jgi:hypothetical protein
MRNATVGTVSQMTDGTIVLVVYKGGESEYVVGPDVPVLAYVLADRKLLKTSAAIVTTAVKQSPAPSCLYSARCQREKTYGPQEGV